MAKASKDKASPKAPASLDDYEALSVDSDPDDVPTLEGPAPDLDAIRKALAERAATKDEPKGS